jgi:hypothetical protein
VEGMRATFRLQGAESCDRGGRNTQRKVFPRLTLACYDLLWLAVAAV